MMPRAALVRHPNPNYPMLSVHMTFDFGDLCSPLLMDVCSQALVPLHMAHYEGRYKAWLSHRNLLQGSKCRCVTKSGTEPNGIGRHRGDLRLHKVCQR